MKVSRHALVAASGLLMIGVLSGCGGDSAGSDASPDAGGGVGETDVATALEYVGGEGGKADSSLEPFTIGFVNGQGAVPSFDEQEAAADAAVDFINEHLGGIDGHPVQLEKCFIQAEEDGQKCAGQLLENPDIHVANMGVSVYGNATFYELIGGKFPTVVTAAVTAADATTDSVYAFDGGSLANLNGIAAGAEEAGYEKLAVIASNNPAAKYLLSEIVLPDLESRGIDATTVYVADTATTPDYVSALQTSGAADADAIELIPATVAGCVSMYDAMKQLSLTKPVVTVTQCSNDPMPEKTGGGPENWYITSLMELGLIDSPQANVVLNVMDAAGSGAKTNVGFATKGFGDFLTITKFAKAIGYDNLSAEAFEQQIADFRGPAWMIPGDILCGGNPMQSGLCGDSAANSVFKDGEWVGLEPYQDVTLERK
jgi:branched-chain amino acid transport system substrate-binding protein